MNQKRTKGLARSNYIKKVYFSVPDFSIKKSIDFITVSINYPDHAKKIYGFLEANGFECSSDLKLEESKYSMKRTYKSNHDIASVEIFHDLKDPDNNCYCPPILLKIHDPNRELLNRMDSFFKHLKISPKVSMLELTFDLFPNDKADIVNLYEFLQSHLFLKYGRKINTKKYVTTFYTNNIRHSKAKGMRVYLKPEKNVPKEFVRMELILKRELIKHLGLDITLTNIDSLTLQRFFTFKFINTQAICDYLVWKSRWHIQRMEKRRKGSGNLLKRLIDDFSNNIYCRQVTLMEKVHSLKLQRDMVPQHNRFLITLDDFSKQFFNRASMESFVPNMRTNPSLSPDIQVCKDKKPGVN